MPSSLLPIAQLMLASDSGHPAGVMAVAHGPYGIMPFFIARVPGCMPPGGADAMAVALRGQPLHDPATLVS